MLVNKTMYRVIRVDYVCNEEMDTDDAEQTITNALCDAGNAIIGDDLCDEVKIQIVSDCGASV